MVVTMHPQSTGRGSRIRLLRNFIEFVLDHGGAEFVRADAIADAVPSGARRSDDQRSTASPTRASVSARFLMFSQDLLG